MKLWLILLTALTISLSGCAAEKTQLPNFELAARDTSKEVSNPVLLPELCEWPWTTGECLQRLDVYEDVAIGNTELAQLNADIARDGEEAYDHILSAAEKQQSIALLREDMLQAERNDHLMDNLWHRALIALMALGMIL